MAHTPPERGVRSCRDGHGGVGMKSSSVARWFALVSGLVFSTALGCGGGPTTSELDSAVADGAAPDGARPCSTQVDCDDGTYCNGRERCAPAEGSADARGCVRGVAPCEASVCDEAGDRCNMTCSTDADADGVVAQSCGGMDCDDGNAAVHAGALEACDVDGLDEDCDPTTFGVRDADADGYLDHACCNGAMCGDDCNDAVATSHPTAPEACDSSDQDCDGAIDEGVLVTVYVDSDGDGFGAGSPQLRCAGAAGYASLGTDCNDGDPSVHPGATDFCMDGIDPDCVPGDGSTAIPQCPDNDDDGYPGVRSGSVSDCRDLPGYAPCSLIDANQIDCDDASAEDHPGATELCNGDDEDCNPADESIASCVGAHAMEVCDGGACTVTSCSSGFADCNHLASDGCESDLATTLTCGACGVTCGFGPHSTPVCGGSGCAVICESGYQDCDVAIGCESAMASDPLHCGSCSRACPVPAHASPTCTAGSCGFACLAGFDDCDGASGNGCETDLASADHCGACGTVCPARANADRTCTASGCGFSCLPGSDDCDGLATNGCEVLLGTDPAHCGRCGNPCPAVANGTRTCSSGTCGFDCDAGYAPSGSTCVSIPAPRLVAPLSTAVVTTQRPTIRWALAAPATGGHVQICAERACTSIEHEGDGATSYTPTIDLTPGVHFVRVFGTRGVARSNSASFTWELVVPVQSAATDTQSGSIADFEADGIADVLVGADTAVGSGRAYVYPGAAGTGPATTPSRSFDAILGAGSSFGSAVAAVPDVNGDGFGDAIVGAYGADRAVLYLGSATGLATVGTTLVSPAGAGSYFGYAVTGIGDVDADGYGDIAIGAYRAGTGGDTGAVYVYHGGSSGLRDTSAPEVLLPTALHGDFGYALAGGDLDADGVTDLVVGEPYAAGGGAVWIFRGRAGTTMASGSGVSASSRSFFGCALATGDIDRNGYPDVIVADQALSSYTGVVHYYLASSGGVPSTPSGSRGGPAANASFGVSISAGDLNADGYLDVAVGAMTSPFSTQSGQVFVYHGSASGLSANAATTISTTDVRAYLGRSVAIRGDTNRDGYADLVVGAFGRLTVDVLRGTAAGIPPSASPAPRLSAPDGGEFGVSVE